MRFSWTLLLLVPFFSQLAYAELEAMDQFGCRKYKDGQCVDGALTDMAKSMRKAKEYSNTETVGSCGKICETACPNCGKCSLCSFCWIYNSDSCKGVGYYTDRETCTEKQTESCCDLCEAHCGDNGACSEGEYCRGGDKTTSTIVKCIEQTQGEICEKCTKGM